MDRASGGSVSVAARRGRWILIVAFVLSFVVNMLRLSGPLFMILIYDRVLPARSQETLVALFAMVVAFLIALEVVDYARRRMLARFGAQFQERLEEGLLARAGQSDLFEATGGKPVAGLDEVDRLRAFFHSASLISIYDLVWTPMFLVVIFVLDPLLGWVTMGGMASILTFVLIRMSFGGRLESDATAASRGIGDLKSMLIASRETIRTQEAAREFKARWLAARRTSRDRAVALKDWTGWFDGLCDLAVTLTRYSVLATGAWLTLQGTLTIGAMVAATFLVARVLVPVEKFMTELPEIAEAWSQWRRLKTVLAAAGEASDASAENAGGQNPRLSLKNVAVRSPRNGSQILKNISLDVAPGRMIEIVGRTGSGKTVLAETMLGLWKRSGGTVLVNGVNLGRLGAGETGHLFGYLPESPGFIAGTLAENIAHLDPDPDPEGVAAAARKACLHGIVTALPEGYETRIDPVGSGLSRGQRSQLALARALYRLPGLVVIDDMDSMLLQIIPLTMDKTFDQLLGRGSSIVMLTREPLNLRQISASYQLEDGKLKLLLSKAAARAGSNIAVFGGTPPKPGKSATTRNRG